jgi:hypothetical protein
VNSTYLQLTTWTISYHLDSDSLLAVDGPVILKYNQSDLVIPLQGFPKQQFWKTGVSLL